MDKLYIVYSYSTSNTYWKPSFVYALEMLGYRVSIDTQSCKQSINATLSYSGLYISNRCISLEKNFIKQLCKWFEETSSWFSNKRPCDNRAVFLHKIHYG